MCYKHSSFKIFVVVISKEGLVGRPPQSFFWYDTIKAGDYKFIVGAMSEEGLLEILLFRMTTTKIRVKMRCISRQIPESDHYFPI